MPDAETKQAAKRARRQGKSASTQAGEYVREEIEHVRDGKHGVKSTKQAIAIGLSKARRDGVDAKPSKSASKTVKKKASQDLNTGKRATKKTSSVRSKATKKALNASATKQAAKKAVSKKALSSQTKKSAAKRTSADRSAAAKKAARTKGPSVRKAAAKKAARTRSSS